MQYYRKKIYGQSQQKTCAFCGKLATLKNPQGAEVCIQHKQSLIEEIKCTCGSWLELRSGKFGSYYNCINCGNINRNKAEEIKEMTRRKNKENNSSENRLSENKLKIKSELKEPKKEEFKEKKEITITSRDVEYF